MMYFASADVRERGVQGASAPIVLGGAGAAGGRCAPASSPVNVRCSRRRTIHAELAKFHAGRVERSQLGGVRRGGRCRGGLRSVAGVGGDGRGDSATRPGRGSSTRPCSIHEDWDHKYFPPGDDRQMVEEAWWYEKAGLLVME